MKTTSAPNYSTPFIDTMAVETTTPFDLLAIKEAMQANFLRGLHTPTHDLPEDILKQGSLVDIVAVDPVMGFMAQAMAEFHERRRLADARWIQKSMLHTHFGKWLQNDEKAIVANAKEGLETLEDRLSVLPYVVEKIRSRRGWKAEMNQAQDPANYADESLDYDLPPRIALKLTIRKVTKRHPNGKTWKIPFKLEIKALKKGWTITKRPTTRSHVPAFYSITGPSGRNIDLSKPHGSFKPILSNNPNDAFRRFITRLGVERKGGETELLNLLLKADKVDFTDPYGVTSSDYKWLPTYVSRKMDGVWFVSVGWKLNPKCQYGMFRREAADGSMVMPFVENAKGELEPFIHGVHLEGDILTTSQLDYKLLCEDSGMAIVDKNEDIVDYMNESEELVMEGFIRDDDHADEEVDNFLLVQAASEMDRMIDLRVGSAVWLLDGFEAQVFEHTKHVGAECHALKQLIRAKKAEVAEFALSTPPDGFDQSLRDAEGKELAYALERLQNKLTSTRANYRLAADDLKAQTRLTLWTDNHARKCVGTPRSSAADAFSAPLPASVNVLGGHPMAGADVTVIAGASNEPRNVAVLATAKINEVERIVPTASPMRLLQSGLTRLCTTPTGTVSTRMAAKPPARHTTPKNANPRLQHTLMRLTLGLAPA